MRNFLKNIKLPVIYSFLYLGSHMVIWMGTWFLVDRYIETRILAINVFGAVMYVWSRIHKDIDEHLQFKILLKNLSKEEEIYEKKKMGKKV